TGGDKLVLAGVGELVARDLLNDKLIVRKILVEGFDDPIAIIPDEPWLVLFKAIGVGVTRGVQPNPAPTLTVMRRGKQALDLFFISVFAFVREEGIEFGNGW